MSIADELRDLLMKHTAPIGREFELSARNETTYDAVYAGKYLPPIDFQQLGAHLAAKPEIAMHETVSENGRGQYPIGAMYDGFLHNQEVVLHLRCGGPS